jgi:hypothetical protein
LGKDRRKRLTVFAVHPVMIAISDISI